MVSVCVWCGVVCLQMHYFYCNACSYAHNVRALWDCVAGCINEHWLVASVSLVTIPQAHDCQVSLVTLFGVSTAGSTGSVYFLTIEDCISLMLPSQRFCIHSWTQYNLSHFPYDHKIHTYYSVEVWFWLQSVMGGHIYIYVHSPSWSQYSLQILHTLTALQASDEVHACTRMSMTHCMSLTAYTGYFANISKSGIIEDHILEVVRPRLPSTLVH